MYPSNLQLIRVLRLVTWSVARSACGKDLLVLFMQILTSVFISLHAAPEFTLDHWPASRQVQSKHNTPIEGFWRWKQDGEGHSIRQAIFVGRDAGLFNSNNPLHVCVFPLFSL